MRIWICSVAGWITKQESEFSGFCSIFRGGFPCIGSGENLYVRDFEGELWHEKCLLTHCRNCESTSNFKLTRLRNVNIILWTCDLGDFYPKRIQTPSMLRCQCCFPWKKPRRRWPGTWTSHGSSKGPECWYNGEVDVLIIYILYAPYIYIRSIHK